MKQKLSVRIFSEALATAFLLAAVVGSGIMGERLSGGNVAIALLGNTISTGSALVVLILIFGPVSGAHMNPAVTLASAMRGELPWRDIAPYIVSQIVGGIFGVFAAHLMFELPVLEVATKVRFGMGQWIAESIAAFGLGLTIFGCLANVRAALPYAVGLYITSAYWFTASTSFANPAVTMARSLTDTFAGIAPGGVCLFILAQILGMILAVWTAAWIWPLKPNDKFH